MFNGPALFYLTPLGYLAAAGRYAAASVKTYKETFHLRQALGLHLILILCVIVFRSQGWEVMAFHWRSLIIFVPLASLWAYGFLFATWDIAAPVPIFGFFFQKAFSFLGKETGEYLFAYGTLQDADIQQQVFERTLTGEPDTLSGFALDQNNTPYPFIRPGQANDFVSGTCYPVTPSDLFQADDYEGEEYQRISVTLKSGRKAWAYIDNRLTR